jgi:maleate cis-trans isomerase
MADRVVTAGFLYPGHAAEDDYPLLQTGLGGGTRLRVVRTDLGEDAHRVDALLEMGSPDRLRQGLRDLRTEAVAAVVWACTSGSFVRGLRGARRQADDLARAAGVPASSTSFAFVHAITALRVHRVSIGATSPDEVAEYFVRFLADSGIEVTRVSARGIVTAAEVATLGRDQVLRLARDNDHPDAEAVLLPDTALHTAACLGQLDATVAKPVLTANQVTVWEALRLVGDTEPRPGLGRLFSR